MGKLPEGSGARRRSRSLPFDRCRTTFGKISLPKRRSGPDSVSGNAPCHKRSRSFDLRRVERRPPSSASLPPPLSLLAARGLSRHTVIGIGPAMSSGGSAAGPVRSERRVPHAYGEPPHERDRRDLLVLRVTVHGQQRDSPPRTPRTPREGRQHERGAATVSLDGMPLPATSLAHLPTCRSGPSWRSWRPWR